MSAPDELGRRAAFDRLRTVRRSRHAGDRLHPKVWPEPGHVFTTPTQDEVHAWLDAVL